MKKVIIMVMAVLVTAYIGFYSFCRAYFYFHASEPIDEQLYWKNSASKVKIENITRRRSKILIELDTNWELDRIEFGSEDWRQRTPFAVKKRIHRSGVSPDWEEDYYFTDNMFIADDSSSREMLAVHYDWLKNEYQFSYSGLNATVIELTEASKKHGNDHQQFASIFSEIKILLKIPLQQ